MPPEESLPAPASANAEPRPTRRDAPRDGPYPGKLPPWLDELAAVVCIVGGIISVLALLEIATENAMARSWASALRTLFGEGSLLIAVAITLLGVRLLLPGNRRLPVAPRRILGGEIAFLALLALFHFRGGQPELASILHRGRDGGIIGWGLGSLSQLLGQNITIGIYALLTLLGLALGLGLGRRRAAAHFHHACERLEEMAALLQGGVKSESTTGEESSLPRINLHGGPQLISRRGGRLMRISRAPFARQAASSRTRRRPAQQESGPHVTVTADTPVNDEILASANNPNTRPNQLPAIEYLHQEVTQPAEHQRETEQTAARIEAALREFDIEVDVVDIQVGPTVTQYAIQPYKERSNQHGENARSQLIRISKIATLQDDLALALKAQRLRMQAPVPGQRVIGIEVPNREPQRVTLRSVYESAAHQASLRRVSAPLFAPLGRDVSGRPISMHIGTLPHLLIAGTTGSGKSVCIATMLSALLLDHSPDTLQMVLLDPKMVELTRFQGLPQLVGPVETDPDRIVAALNWCVGEMTRRYHLLEEAAARNLATYNAQTKEPLPYLLLVIDEIGDVMLTKGAAIERPVVRLAQMARAVGMHLIVATQRPSVDVFTGLIKANFPARIAFHVASSVDSRVVLDSTGAESLLGRGDMLYLAPDAAGPRRIQGCFVDDEEVRAIVQHWSAWGAEQIARGHLTPEAAAPWERQLQEHRMASWSEGDALLLRAINTLRAEGLASASLLQRRLGLGYPRAARLIDTLDELGLLGEAAPRCARPAADLTRQRRRAARPAHRSRLISRFGALLISAASCKKRASARASRNHCMPFRFIAPQPCCSPMRRARMTRSAAPAPASQ